MNWTKYIAIKRFKESAICGEVNLPYGTQVLCVDNILYYDVYPICFATSQNAYDHFARNDDGMGLERGRLTQSIQSSLAKRDARYQERWDKVWEDKLCQKYHRKEFSDYWLWNHAFYNAPIEDLKYIEGLVKR